jgi:hypothetical protein
MEGKRNNKIMIRRKESVDEKMMYEWLKLILYKLMRECEGEKLLMMLREMKKKVEKGNVDEIK